MSEHLLRDLAEIIERSLSGEHLEKQEPYRVEVGARVRLLARCLLGGHVARCSDRVSFQRDLPNAVGVRDAEVENLHRTVAGQKDVGWFDVAMHDADRMRCGETEQRLLGDACGEAGRKLALALESLANRLAHQQLHHVVRSAVGGSARVDHVDDVRMT